MYAIDFEYDNKKLSDFGMMICSFDGNGGTESVSSGNDITFKQFKPSGSNNFYISSYDYEESFTATFQICKNPCINNYKEIGISAVELSSVQRWLSKKRYRKFKIIQDGYEDIYWNATFSCKQINIGGQCMGLELTLFTDAPYAYKDNLHLEFDASGDLSFKIYSVSDDIGFINPNITIQVLTDGDLTIKNSMDDYYTQVKNCSYLEEIQLDCKNKLISTSSNSHNISKDFNFMFPKIYNSEETNENLYTVSLPCNIVIDYSPIIKVGL